VRTRPWWRVVVQQILCERRIVLSLERLRHCISANTRLYQLRGLFSFLFNGLFKLFVALHPQHQAAIDKEGGGSSCTQGDGDGAVVQDVLAKVSVHAIFLPPSGVELHSLCQRFQRCIRHRGLVMKEQVMHGPKLILSMSCCRCGGQVQGFVMTGERIVPPFIGEVALGSAVFLDELSDGSSGLATELALEITKFSDDDQRYLCA